jgi:hypothetical protein
MADIGIYQNNKAHAQNLAALVVEKGHTPNIIENERMAEDAIQKSHLILVDWDAEDSSTKINERIAEMALDNGCHVVIYSSLENVEQKDSYKSLNSHLLVLNRRDDKQAALVIICSLADAFRTAHRVREVNFDTLRFA